MSGCEGRGEDVADAELIQGNLCQLTPKVNTKKSRPDASPSSEGPSEAGTSMSGGSSPASSAAPGSTLEKADNAAADRNQEIHDLEPRNLHPNLEKVEGSFKLAFMWPGNTTSVGMQGCGQRHQAEVEELTCKVAELEAGFKAQKSEYDVMVEGFEAKIAALEAERKALSSDAAESAVDMDKAAEHIIALGNTINTAAAAAATQKQAHRTAIRALEADLEPFLTAKEDAYFRWIFQVCAMGDVVLGKLCQMGDRHCGQELGAYGAYTLARLRAHAAMRFRNVDTMLAACGQNAGHGRRGVTVTKNEVEAWMAALHLRCGENKEFLVQRIINAKPELYLTHLAPPFL